MAKLRTNYMHNSAISSIVFRFQELKTLQKFPQHNAIEKIWKNKDRFRKDPRNQLIISTETNRIPRATDPGQSDDTFHIQINFILVDESVTHLKETCPTS